MAVTADVINGTDIGVYIDGTLIAHATSGALNVSMSPRDTTSKDSGGWKTILPGLKEWSIDVDALISYDATNKMQGDIFTLLSNSTQVTVKFSTEATDDDRYTGSAYVTSAPIQAGTEDNATYSVTFEGDGAITKQTVT